MEPSQNETLHERQENEFQVLQAVFMEEMVDLRENDPWKVTRPPEVQITLIPQESMGGKKNVYTKVDLHVKCGIHYPDEVPELNLKNAKGLSNHNLAELAKELHELATKLRGEVMILELAQHVQNYLHCHNQPRFDSFYDEMLSNHRKQQEELMKEQERKLTLQRIKDDKQRKAIEEEIHRKQEALREEIRLRKEFTKQSDQTSTNKLNELNLPSPLFPVRRERSRSTEIAPASQGQLSSLKNSDLVDLKNFKLKQCHHSSTATLKFNHKKERVIQRGKCCGHSSTGHDSFIGLDTETGDLVMVHEWNFKWLHTKTKTTNAKNFNTAELDNYLKQVSNIERELNTLLKLQNEGLVHYMDIKSFVEKDNLTVQLLQEFVSARNISVNNNESTPINFLRHYTSGVVNALAFLHRNSVVHKDLKLSNIFVENSGERIRVADYSIHKKLSDINASINEELISNGVVFPLAIGRGAKKLDIHRLGFIVLSLSLGYIVTDQTPKIPSNLPEDFADFLRNCLSINEQDRWSAEQLQNHPFLKTGVHFNLNRRNLKDIDVTQNNEKHEEPDQTIPLLNTSSVHGQSRLQNEFEVIKWLGKGGFGDVLKARNKLDGRVYAIKRIVLNQHNKLLNKKITREVKLLSRLNHENVVRYFYSWIETVTVDKSEESTNESTSQSVSGKNELKINNGIHIADKLVATNSSDIEQLAPPRADSSVEWSVSHERSAQQQKVEESSSDDDDDDDDDDDEDEDFIFGPSFFSYLNTESSDAIVFENGSKNQNSTSNQLKPESEGLNKTTDTNEESPTLIQFMYIQMEFCERSTLRSAIDAGLNTDENRVWRLFREIVEGLVHIHQQGMIHRDLKPVNIFLDSNDHVKIGDFGLATTDIIAKNKALDTTATTEIKPNLEALASRSDPFDDGTLTGRVGTALYVAPELSSTIKINYNQKVDIYSVGIIFFEMCYHALPTAMERVKVLTNIRHSDIIFPVDFEEEITPQQIYIVRWLLNHDPNKRPTSLELLQSEYLPPPQMEEAELQEMLRHSINNPQSKSYKHIISSLFNQEVTPATDYTYDMDNYKGTFNNRLILTQKFVRNELSKIFQKHGALNVITPLLMPKSSFYEHNDLCVNFIDHSGGVISLPYELRVSFARYLVKNNIVNLKRYTISRVYRERKLFGCQPKELFECAFDIVTPSPGSLIADAEILVVIWEAICEFPALHNRSYVIRVNHSSLIKAIFIYCGIPEEKHNDVYAIIGDIKAENCSKFQIQTKLMNLCLTDQTITMLNNFIEMEGNITKISNAFKSVVKRRDMASTYAKQGLNDLELIIKNSEMLGVKIPIIVNPGLVYGIHQFSGMFFKVVCELKKKRKRSCLDVIAAGGRYDSLVNSMYLTPSSSNTKEASQSAVGVSFALEKIVSAIIEDEEFKPPSAYDVLVYSIGRQSLFKDKALVIRDLWNVGISANMIYDSSFSLEEIQNLCREFGISSIVVLKDLEPGVARVRTLERDRFSEKKMSISEVVDHLQKILGDTPDYTNQSLNRSESTKSCASLEQVTPGSTNFNITFLSLEKLALNYKRRYEAQIASQIATVLQYFSPKACLEILAVDLNEVVLKTVQSNIELGENETSFTTSLNPIIEKHPRHRKYLTRIFDEILEIKFQKKNSLIMLYGLSDSSYRLLL